MTWHDRLREQAAALGFDRVGVAPARLPELHMQAYSDWLARGDHGEMGYMGRPDRVARREDPAVILPGVRSVVSVAANYYPGPRPEFPFEVFGGLPRGRVSNYAWNEDYHQWMLPRLEALAAFVHAQTGGTARHRAYVDTGPVLERAYAVRAGLGFIGKNTCLIDPALGSWLFLGEILVDVDLPSLAEPVAPRCGTCTRCLEACPTGALAAPYRLDARRCISYLTIELKGTIPPHLRPLMGDWIYGCDICQQVCPWQRFARRTSHPAFRASYEDQAAPVLLDLFALGEEGFQRRFAGSPILRIGRERLLRNVAVALGNTADPRAVVALRAALSDAAPLVREHAAWALAAIDGRAAGGGMSEPYRA